MPFRPARAPSLDSDIGDDIVACAIIRTTTSLQYLRVLAKLVRAIKLDKHVDEAPRQQARKAYG